MNFLGMGAMEIIVIMVVALIIFGPERLPEMGAQAGKALRDFRNMTREVTGDFEESITDVRSAMDEMKMTVADVQRETREFATSVTEIADSAAEEVRAGARTVNEQSAEVAAVVNSGASTARPNGVATESAVATRPSNGQTSAGQTTATKPKAATTTGARKKVAKKPAKPTKQDPLADLGGIDEG